MYFVPINPYHLTDTTIVMLGGERRKLFVYKGCVGTCSLIKLRKKTGFKYMYMYMYNNWLAIVINM